MASLIKLYLLQPIFNILLFRDIDIQKILQHAAVDWDGGYVIAGMIGSGDTFVFRDPAGNDDDVR